MWTVNVRASNYLGYTLFLIVMAFIVAALLTYWLEYGSGTRYQAENIDPQSRVVLNNQYKVLDNQREQNVKIDELQKNLQSAQTSLEQAAHQIRVKAAGDTFLKALANKNTKEISRFAHPQKGIRFTPYSNVQNDNVILNREDLRNIFLSNAKYNWGFADGSGEPLLLSFHEYYSRYIYDQDYKSAPEISFNKLLSFGNAINNAEEYYPDADILEYYFPGFDSQYEGLDWRSIQLAVEEYQGVLYIVGVIHNEWTI